MFAAVVATGATGMVFCRLRRRSGSVVAPAITHAARKGLAVVGGLVVARSLGAWARRPAAHSRNPADHAIGGRPFWRPPSVILS